MNSESNSLKSEQANSPKEDRKYTSKREKKPSTKLLDSAFAGYTPETGFESVVKSKREKVSPDNVRLTSGGKRKAAVSMTYNPVKK